MNLIGKVFTVLIFVFSLVFMTMALMVYATHKNWREEITKSGGLKEQLTQAKNQNDVLTHEKAKIKKDLDDLQSDTRDKLGELETDISLKKNEITQIQQEQATLKQSERDAVAAMASTQAEAKKLREEVEGLRQKEEEAQKDRDLHFKEMQRLTDELHDRVNELATLKERSRTLAADLAKATETLRLFKLNPNIDYANVQPPDVRGFVQAVRPNGLVEISLGHDDGVRKGHKLEVYRVTPSGSSYVGRIEVMETTPDKAVCKIDPKFQQSEFKNGDRVTSKLDR
jgi:phosphoglycolate phosphatase-like HAD superfamily hydrolase